MSSSTNSSNSVVNIESVDVTCTTSGSVGDVSDSDKSKFDSPSYKWVDPCILDIPTCFRDSNNLDKFLSKVAFLKPYSLSDALIADICGYID